MIDPQTVQKAGKILQEQLEASIWIHIVKYPEDDKFDNNPPCFRVTVTAIDPDSGTVEDGPYWRDISPSASPEECTFVVKAEKLASRFARIFKRKKPRPLNLKIKAEPLPAWEVRYDSVEQTESIKAGDRTSIRLAAVPKAAAISKKSSSSKTA